MPWPFAVALCVGLIALSGLLFGRSPFRIALAWIVAIGGLVVPWLAPVEALFPRAAIALASMLPALRLVDLARDRREWSAAHRVWQFLSPLDAREATRAAPRFDLRALGSALLQCGIFAGTLVLFQALPGLADTPWAGAARVLTGVVAIYTLMGGGSALMTTFYRGVGLELQPMQRAPIVSRTLQEFWGERWNRTINRWLRRNCFAPLARRGRPLLGIVVAFAASALVHTWLVLAPLGGTMALAMGSYFAIEGVLVLAEKWLQVRRWPVPLQRVWTIVAVVGPSPLFMVPMTMLLTNDAAWP